MLRVGDGGLRSSDGVSSKTRAHLFLLPSFWFELGPSTTTPVDRSSSVSSCPLLRSLARLQQPLGRARSVARPRSRRRQRARSLRLHSRHPGRQLLPHTLGGRSHPRKVSGQPGSPTDPQVPRRRLRRCRLWCSRASQTRTTPRTSSRSTSTRQKGASKDRLTSMPSLAQPSRHRHQTHSTSRQRGDSKVSPPASRPAPETARAYLARRPRPIRLLLPRTRRNSLRRPFQHGQVNSHQRTRRLGLTRKNILEIGASY